MITFRPACENDLAQAFEVFYENEVRDELSPPSLSENAPTALEHIRLILGFGEHCLLAALIAVW